MCKIFKEDRNKTKGIDLWKVHKKQVELLGTEKQCKQLNAWTSKGIYGRIIIVHN